MINTTQATPSDEKLKIRLDLETMLIRVELQSLLLSFGAPSTLVKVAATAWADELLIEDDQKAGAPQYYLPIMLIADFIDLILDQLSTDSKTGAVQLRDAIRASGARVSEHLKLKQTKPQGDYAMHQRLGADEARARPAMHKVLSGRHQRPTATSPNHAAPIGQ